MLATKFQLDVENAWGMRMAGHSRAMLDFMAINFRHKAMFN